MVTSLAFQVGLKSCALNHPDEVGAPIVGVDLLDLCLLITLICRLPVPRKNCHLTESERRGKRWTGGCSLSRWSRSIQTNTFPIGTNIFYNLVVLCSFSKIYIEKRTMTSGDDWDDNNQGQRNDFANNWYLSANQNMCDGPFWWDGGCEDWFVHQRLLRQYTRTTLCSANVPPPMHQHQHMDHKHLL